MISDNTKKMVALTIDLDPTLLAKATDILIGKLDWQKEQANDPGYDKWLDEQAMAWNYSHARMPGE